MYKTDAIQLVCGCCRGERKNMSLLVSLMIENNSFLINPNIHVSAIYKVWALDHKLWSWEVNKFGKYWQRNIIYIPLKPVLTSTQWSCSFPEHFWTGRSLKSAKKKKKSWLSLKEDSNTDSYHLELNIYNVFLFSDSSHFRLHCTAMGSHMWSF